MNDIPSFLLSGSMAADSLLVQLLTSVSSLLLHLSVALLVGLAIGYEVDWKVGSNRAPVCTVPKSYCFEHRNTTEGNYKDLR